jgi:hypothetical protein
MGLPKRMSDMEGELSLDLRVDGKKVFDLSFTIVPGWVVKCRFFGPFRTKTLKFTTDPSSTVHHRILSSQDTARATQR